MPGEPWLILPTYNESENLQAIVAAAGAVLAAAAPDGFRVLVVDDGSPDGTGQIADALAAEHDWVRCFTAARRTGSARHTWRASATRSTTAPAT